MTDQPTDLLGTRLALLPTGVSLFMLAREVHENPPWAADPAHQSGPDGVLEQLRRLKADLVRFEDGWAPDQNDLARAPLLEEWGVYFHPAESLWRVVGHFRQPAPKTASWGIAENEQIATMQVLAVDEGFSWVRDRVGFYRLGEPA